jgi:hypothetical protein
MNSNWSGCSAAIGSVTQAMQAQKLLASAAIPSALIKYDAQGGKGCVYGLSFSCAQADNVRTVLSKERIRVREWHTGI